MILQCSHINKSFDGNTILDDISFHINEQEKTALVGINGSGKHIFPVKNTYGRIRSR